MMALAYANGVICFARAVKPDTMLITSGPSNKLRWIVSGLARRAYDGKTLLVPGLPEAKSWDERSEALWRFRAAIEKAFGKGALARRIEQYEAKKRRAEIAKQGVRRG